MKDETFMGMYCDSCATEVSTNTNVSIHMWGADGPGKPAILWHGTVHAREWIVAPVCD
jgi:hypothetical protein